MKQQPRLSWVATLYNCDPNQLQELVKDIVKKAVYQEEICPKTGRKHVQAFFKFTKKYRFKQLQNIFRDFKPHLEPCRNEKQAIEYCSKAETRAGETRLLGTSGVDEKETIKDLVKQGNIGEIRERYFGFYIRHRRALYEECLLHIQPQTREHTRGIWIHGKSGSGKTRKCSAIPDLYWKSPNKWWDGYMNNRIVICDDWDHKVWIWGINYIKRWTDHYVITGETKGGTVNLNYEWLIITSNETLDESLQSVEYNHKEAIVRRFIEISVENIIELDKLIA